MALVYVVVLPSFIGIRNLNPIVYIDKRGMASINKYFYLDIFSKNVLKSTNPKVTAM